MAACFDSIALLYCRLFGTSWNLMSILSMTYLTDPTEKTFSPLTFSGYQKEKTQVEMNAWLPHPITFNWVYLTLNTLSENPWHVVVEHYLSVNGPHKQFHWFDWIMNWCIIFLVLGELLIPFILWISNHIWHALFQKIIPYTISFEKYF